MGQINFDALRAEAGVGDNSITVGGREVPLQPVMSIRFGLALDDGEFEEALGLLVVNPDDVEYLIDHLGMAELNQIAEELYGLEAEEDDGEAPNRQARRERAKKGKGKRA